MFLNTFIEDDDSGLKPDPFKASVIWGVYNSTLIDREDAESTQDFEARVNKLAKLSWAEAQGELQGGRP